MEFKVFLVAILSLGFASVVFSRYNAETGAKDSNNDLQRYSPYISGILLPLTILILCVLEFFTSGVQETAQMVLSMCFGLFLHISLYYVVLMFALPFLRRYIDARACAMLWLIPNILYFMHRSSMEVPRPLLVIRVPEKLVWTLFFVWLTGFLVLLIWKVITHLIFRSRILRNATAVSDPAILELWNSEIAQAKLRNPQFQLVISPNVATPLSIGMFRHTTLVILPKRPYSLDELTLIFRHEIVHIGREDAWAKFFFTFCTAVCWFNPLMWIAMRKSADDLELSCDETVLLDSDADTRRQYANLILHTAGDERGFTTCLSASASAMRYRLKNIMKPKKRHPGALTVGLTVFILCMTYGYVSLAYGSSTGAEMLYQSRDTSLYTLKRITMADGSDTTMFECTDTEAFHEYLAELTMANFTGYYSLTDSGKQLTFTSDTPEGILSVALSDHFIEILSPYVYDKGRVKSRYYLPEGVDWEYLDTLLRVL